MMQLWWGINENSRGVQRKKRRESVTGPKERLTFGEGKRNQWRVGQRPSANSLAYVNLPELGLPPNVDSINLPFPPGTT